MWKNPRGYLAGSDVLALMNLMREDLKYDPETGMGLDGEGRQYCWPCLENRQEMVEVQEPVQHLFFQLSTCPNCGSSFRDRAKPMPEDEIARLRFGLRQ